jgi:hypothetical protein
MSWGMTDRFQSVRTDENSVTVMFRCTCTTQLKKCGDSSTLLNLHVYADRGVKIKEACI